MTEIWLADLTARANFPKGSKASDLKTAIPPTRSSGRKPSQQPRYQYTEAHCRIATPQQQHLWQIIPIRKYRPIRGGSCPTWPRNTHRRNVLVAPSKTPVRRTAAAITQNVVVSKKGLADGTPSLTHWRSQRDHTAASIVTPPSTNTVPMPRPSQYRPTSARSSQCQSNPHQTGR